MVDVSPVPDRFENPICKAENQNVLNSFFAQVVVDAVDLLFIQHLANLFVQFFRRIIIASKWFFNDYAPPAVFFHHQLRRA